MFKSPTPARSIPVPAKATVVPMDLKIETPPEEYDLVGPSESKDIKASSTILHKMMASAKPGKSIWSKRNFKVWINETIPLVIAADGSGNFGFTAYINDVRNLTDFGTYRTIFDQCRILEHCLVFDAGYSVSTGGTVQPGIVVAFDIDNSGSSSIATAGTSAVLNYQGGPYPVWHHHSTSNFEIHLKFYKTQKKTDTIVSSTDLYSTPGSWTNTASGAGTCGGFRAANVSATAASRPIGFIYRSWYLEFAFKYS